MPQRFPLPSIYRIAHLLIDGAIAAAVCMLAFWLRFEGQVDPDHQFLAFVLPSIAIPGRLLSQGIFGLYQQVWRTFGLRDAVILGNAVSFYSLTVLFTTRLLIPRFWPSFTGLSLGVAAIDWSFCLMFMVAVRYARRRSLVLSQTGQLPAKHPPRRVLVLGAGMAGAQVARESRQNRTSPFTIVGFLDDDLSKLGRRVEGIRILGKLSDTAKFARELSIDEVLIAVPSANASQLKQIMAQGQTAGLRLRIIPWGPELLSDRTLLPQARDIQIADILGRPEVHLNLDQALNLHIPSAQSQVQGKTVLVTGAGGTIGGEICRQLARLKPQNIILLGRGENSIFNRERELNQQFPDISFIPIIADVRHQHRMSWVLETYCPFLIFHAAAHKHVPLMEANPTEALENNALATAQLASLSSRLGVNTFVLISTDKAVDSSNFMGLSKRLAELLVKAQTPLSQTRFLAVRFGNVLGSRGSVVPIFQAQIARGGPVTVTDPRMTRYFMTVPEAAQLVIQSLAVGKSGQTLILDMGEPVKILDLAEQMIRLAGCEPHTEIPIQMTGLRPGEKLHEALLCESEEAIATPHPKLTAVLDQPPTNTAGAQVLVELRHAVTHYKDHDVLWETAQGWVEALTKSHTSAEVAHPQPSNSLTR